MLSFVVVAGAPGSGKGTQCARLAQQLGLVHVSAGDLLREEVESGSTLATQVRRSMEGGQLVPDHLVTEIVSARLAGHDDGAEILLDGFPRTVAQAEALDALHPGSMKLSIELVVPITSLLRRLGLRGRVDDRLDVVRRRLVSYARDTWPLLKWLAGRGLLVHVDGNRSPEAVTLALRDQLARVGMGVDRVPA